MMEFRRESVRGRNFSVSLGSDAAGAFCPGLSGRGVLASWPPSGPVSSAEGSPRRSWKEQHSREGRDCTFCSQA